jgi:carboxypeptidase PM20D1
MSSMADHLAKAIQIPTISHQNPNEMDYKTFHKFHQFLANTYPLCHKHMKVEKINQLSLLYKWEGRDLQLNPIIFAAHIDVVPIAHGTLQDWTYPPFEGIVAEDYLWGRGTMDCKCFLIGLMEAAEALLNQGFQPHRTIYFAFGHDEEVKGFNGAKQIAELLASRNIQAEMVIDEGGFIINGAAIGIHKNITTIGICEKGTLTLQLQATAQGGHSSIPPKRTAIGEIAKAIDRIQTHPLPAELTPITLAMFKSLMPHLPAALRFAIKNTWLLAGIMKKILSKNDVTNALIRTTIAPTILQSGTKENVLPQEARLILNIRLLPGQNVDGVINHIRKVIANPEIGIEIYEAPFLASPISDINSEAYHLLVKTIQEVFPGTVAAPNLLTGMTDSRFYYKICKNVFRFSPLRLSNEDKDRPHGTNERISLSNFQEIIDFYLHLMKNI